MTSPDPSFGTRERLRYRFDLLLSRGAWAVLLVLGLVTLCVVVVGAVLVTLSGQTFEGGDNASLLEDFWQTLLRTMDPGTMAGDVGWGRRVLSLVVTLFGILVAGTLIGLIASGIEQYVEEMQRGRSVVVESGHVVVLGSSTRLPGLVDQLTLAGRRRRGNTIVVLADREPRELSDEIRAVVTDPRGSRLVIRSGDPTRRSDLALVGVARAREIIVLADDGDGADARAVGATLAAGAELEGFDRVPIVVEMGEGSRSADLVSACGGLVSPLVPSQAIARLTAYALGSPGVGLVVQTLLDFDGSTLYARPFGEAAGRTFGECVTRFADVRPIGSMDRSGAVHLNPHPDTILTDDTRLVAVADDGSSTPEERDSSAAAWSDGNRATLGRQQTGHTLMVGWNDFASLLVEQLLESSASGSTVDVVYDARLIDEIDIEPGPTVRITPTRTDVWQPDADTRLAEYTTIVLIAYRDGCSPDEADSRTLLNLMTMTAALESAGRSRPWIIAELLDDDHADLAARSGADDCLVSDTMASRLLAQIAEQPELRAVYLQLYAQDGASVHLVAAVDLGVAGTSSWGEVVDRCYGTGLIAIGWRQAPDRGDRLVLNPHVADVVTLDPGDQVVVVG